MTEKICDRCGTFILAGKFCPECGQQLYPDVGRTIWKIPDIIKVCSKPKFDVWSGKKL